MKPTNTIIALVLVSFSITASAQDMLATDTSEQNTTALTKKKQKLNFFIVSKRKKGKLDPATRFNVLRTKIKSLSRPKSFVAIIAADAEQASAKIRHRLEKYNASIGTIWFDSHGAYKRGYSLFYIGHNEISFKNINDSSSANAFTSLTPYANYDTRLVIGSCYGGATYQRSSIDYRDTTHMNGDSLMMALGKFFPQARIYGSESWVMTKPGIFNDHKAAVAGFPKRKLFRDVCYRPAWENIGKWNEYNAVTGTLTHINSITLDSYGNLAMIRWSYNGKPGTQNDIQKNILKLEADLFK
ncbi:MAG TPA: hypothetical protein VGQ04_00145 [Chitinophagaceae bacterium]|nr:hypothetical protein [Chitinophagaceae bacterium]